MSMNSLHFLTMQGTAMANYATNPLQLIFWTFQNQAKNSNACLIRWFPNIWVDRWFNTPPRPTIAFFVGRVHVPTSPLNPPPAETLNLNSILELTWVLSYPLIQHPALSFIGRKIQSSDEDLTPRPTIASFVGRVHVPTSPSKPPPAETLNLN